MSDLGSRGILMEVIGRSLIGRPGAYLGST